MEAVHQAAGAGFFGPPMEGARLVPLLVDFAELALSLFAILALLMVFLTVAGILAVYLFRSRAPAVAEAARPPTTARPSAELADPAAPEHAARSGTLNRTAPVSAVRDVRIDVPTRHTDALLGALKAAGFNARETGEVVATDEDEEGLTTLALDVPDAAGPNEPGPLRMDVALKPKHELAAEQEAGNGESGTIHPPASRPAPIEARGDLTIAEGTHFGGDIHATGNILVGQGSRLLGSLSSGGSIRILRGAIVGSVACKAELFLEDGAHVNGRVDAGRGIRRVT